MFVISRFIQFPYDEVGSVQILAVPAGRQVIRNFKPKGSRIFVKEFFPEYAEVYFSYPPGIYRADIFRVMAVLKCGGVYADIDVECRQPLDELLEFAGDGDWEVLLTRDHPIHEKKHFKGRKVFVNDFFVAKPGASFLQSYMDRISNRVAERGLKNPANAVFETGPILFSETLEDEIVVNLSGGKESKVRYIPWERDHPLPDMTNDFPDFVEWQEIILSRSWKFDPEPFVVHYWYHTWCAGGTMLENYGESLLQSDGEIVESRLQRWIPYFVNAG